MKIMLDQHRSYADKNCMRTAFTRIAYVTLIGGIIGGVWWLGRVQHEDLQMNRYGLPAPKQAVVYIQAAER